jgi:hypothetical protein
MRPDAIVLHHSLTKDGACVSWPAIRKYHTSYRCEGHIIDPFQVPALIDQGAPVERPWSDIGYHYGIELINDRYEILNGRMLTEPGAHCPAQGMNRRAIGICFIGDFDLAPPSRDQLAIGLSLVRSLMKVFSISLGRIYGHGEVARDGRSCPGKRFNLPQFRTDLLTV